MHRHCARSGCPGVIPDRQYEKYKYDYCTPYCEEIVKSRDVILDRLEKRELSGSKTDLILVELDCLDELEEVMNKYIDAHYKSSYNLRRVQRQLHWAEQEPENSDLKTPADTPRGIPSPPSP